ncbi:MAG: proline dehydrogenase [Marinilabiliales bacterium]|nr:MAG: proline dehydrogenase [Marinilabiliales bacterium]
MQILQNTEIAFKIKTDSELRKAEIMFRMMSSPLAVNIMGMLAKLALGLRIPLRWIVKPTVFSLFCGGESLDEAKKVVEKLSEHNVLSVTDFAAENRRSEDEINQVITEIVAATDYAGTSEAVPFSVFKPTALAPPGVLEETCTFTGRQATDLLAAGKFRENIRILCEAAHKRSVPVMIDAEECQYQQLIDDICEEMMEIYNKEKAVVFNTLQMYRHDRHGFLKEAVARARKKRYFAGYKLVRGAYMDQERERAKKLGYPSPIHPDKESTDKAFDDAVTTCLENLDMTSLFVGTHNEESLLRLMEQMKDMGIPKDDPRICVSQLYGMSDHISFNMAAHQYNVAKYLPYGPIKYLIPYLIRRAEENRSVTGQSGRELHYIRIERKRRKKISKT